MSHMQINTDPAALLRDTYVQVDLAALAGNMDAIRAMVGPDVAVMPVVKAMALAQSASPQLCLHTVHAILPLQR